MFLALRGKVGSGWGGGSAWVWLGSCELYGGIFIFCHVQFSFQGERWLAGWLVGDDKLVDVLE